MGCVRTEKEEGSMAALKGLKPEKVFEYFEKLCSVPHGSGNTKLISDLCVGFAKELGLRYRQEACNNLIIWKDGSAGYEQSGFLCAFRSERKNAVEYIAVRS